jgi:hypothetical protein
MGGLRAKNPASPLRPREEDFIFANRAVISTRDIWADLRSPNTGEVAAAGQPASKDLFYRHGPYDCGGDGRSARVSAGSAAQPAPLWSPNHHPGVHTLRRSLVSLRYPAYSFGPLPSSSALSLIWAHYTCRSADGQHGP